MKPAIILTTLAIFMVALVSNLHRVATHEQDHE
jgi:hypothetical protein